MSIHYCRLRLSVQEPLKVTDLFYRFVVTNNKTKKSTKFEGYFDAQGLTQWTEIHNMDTTLEYIVFFRSTLIQRISVVAYPNKTIQNNFTLKTTTEMTKIMNENIFEMYLDDGQVGWYFVKKTETMLDWSKRIFKQMLVPSDWEVLRTNNPHIDHIQPIRLLTPGMIVVLSNSTKAKQLPQYKNDAQQAQKNLDEMKKDKSFDAEFFALNYEFFYDSLKYEEFVGISTTPINDVDGKGSAVGSTVKNTVDGALVFVAEVKNRTLNSYAKITENYMVEHKNKTRLANSKHFDKFVSANANLFRDFDNNIAKKMFIWDTGTNITNLRREIKRTAFVRGANSRGGVPEYLKNMKEVGRVSKILKKGGNFMVGVGVLEAGVNVYHAAATGDSKETRKAVLVEPLKLGGSLIGGRLGAGAGATAAVLVIGVGTGGLGLIVIGAAAVAGGFAGGVIGGAFGEMAGIGMDRTIDWVDNQ